MSAQPDGRPGSGPKREFRGPDEVLAFVEGIRERTRQAVERYEQSVEQVGDLTGEGFSTDRTVRAEVDENGVVAKLDIADVALRRGGHLAEMILAAIREAQAARALKMAEVGASLGGERTAAVVRQALPQHLRDVVDRRGGRR